jgi:hypothetical protein
MRELEGLSHEQIAKSLGLSGGAVRQSIYRARTTLRNGAGMIVPLPVLRYLVDGIGPDAATSAAAGGGGVGIGMAAKAGVATLLAAGTVTTGVVVNHERQIADAAAIHKPSARHSSSEGATHDVGDDSGRGGGQGDNSGPGSGHDGSGRRRSGDDGSGHSGSGSASSGSGSGDSSGSGPGSDDSSSSGPGPSGSGTSGSGTSGSGSSGSGSSGSGGDDGLPEAPDLPQPPD